MIHGSLVILALVVTVVAQQPATPNPRVGGEKEFFSGLKSAQAQMAAGKFKDAKAAYDRLLGDHASQPYVFPHRMVITDDLKRCAFRMAHPAAEPKSVVDGQLLSYDLASGRIKIKYDVTKGSDFVFKDNLKVFPPRFAGPHSIEFKGLSYPGAGVGPIALVCSDDDVAYRVIWGYPAQGSSTGGQHWVPGYVHRLTGATNETELDKKEQPPTKPGKAFTLKVEVGERSIVASYNGTTYMRGTKDAKHWGTLAFTGMSPTEVTIDGKIEPSWIQNKIDTLAQERLAVFEQSWNPKQVVPAWLIDAPKDAKQTEDDDDSEAEFPVDLTLREEAALVKVLSAIRNGQFDAAIVALQGIAGDEVSELNRDWLTAYCHAHVGDFEVALPLLERVAAAQPGFALVYYKLAEAHEALQRPADAVKALERALELSPRSEGVHVRLIVNHLVGGRVDEARQVLERAGKAGIVGEDTSTIRSMVDKATRGPNWAKVHDAKSTHYHVFSDIDRETCRKASEVLEQAYDAYNARLKGVADAGKPMRVYIFSGEAGYHAYCADVLQETPMHTAGLYTPLLKQLLIWNLPERADMMRTVRHEGFHQYLDRLVANPPIWFNEGMAEYYEVADAATGSLKLGQFRKDHADVVLQVLESGSFDLGAFVRLTPQAFYAEAELNYPIAWAFVHFLRHTPAQKRLFDGFFADLCDGVPPQKAVRKHFPADSMVELKKPFLAYLRAPR